ncbi:hypothetical protein RB614_00555 [Phytohabitans sp. ZYX-F-186]|uniref:Uncharacterized protein n=1 Tax=Phytohabitans maris TaxID=3071409 RepID=A0ABU0Z964_9ACTN|nr:hypothetical protein [Phytohabitans sp. ZYX-F-186]MDQ7903009.1 hypothetical protein [Phytohabitans sp. ZYX-F-186]
MRPVLVVAAALAAAFLLPATPAAAHPFGPPSTARVSADGSRVAVSWQAAEDDWVALGRHVGAFDTASPDVTGAELLRRSPGVRDYLLGRIAVSQGGRPCAADLAELEDVLAQGARLTFDCPGQVAEVDLTVTALTDVNEAYRTVLRADTPATPDQALFTAAVPTQHITFAASGGSGVRRSVVRVAIATAAVLVLGLGFFLARRQRARSDRRPAGARS